MWICLLSNLCLCTRGKASCIPRIGIGSMCWIWDSSKSGIITDRPNQKGPDVKLQWHFYGDWWEPEKSSMRYVRDSLMLAIPRFKTTDSLCLQMACFSLQTDSKLQLTPTNFQITPTKLQEANNDSEEGTKKCRSIQFIRWHFIRGKEAVWVPS